jgi:hypothetical protein
LGLPHTTSTTGADPISKNRSITITEGFYQALWNAEPSAKLWEREEEVVEHHEHQDHHDPHDVDVQVCKHPCKNKLACKHECCKRGQDLPDQAPHEPREPQDQPAPKKARLDHELPESLYSISYKTLEGITRQCLVSKSMTVIMVKKLIEIQGGYPMDAQRLIFAGSNLNDDDMLSSTRVPVNGTVHVLFKLRGC